jgi:chemotaxis protein methyltransferase CheR
MLTHRQFERTQRLALSLAGLELVERHRELLARRSRRHGICDDAGLDALLNAAEEGESSATQRLVCLLTTKFTGFFRHPRHFETAAKHALQVAGLRGRARLWSAGTATGEEAWSLAMALVEVFPRDNPPTSILGTDVDMEALALAQRGEYGPASLQALSQERRERFFSETGVPQRQRIASSVRPLVEFRLLNFVSEDWPVEGPFDVIFCRNVLMYLEAHHRHIVLQRLAGLLQPQGLLFLDPTEHLGPAGHWFAPQASGVYSLRTPLKLDL